MLLINDLQINFINENFQPPLSQCVKSKLLGIKLHDIKELFLIFKLLIAMFKSSYLSEIDIRI